MVSESETVEMEVHQLLKGDVDTGLVCLSGADLDELVEANRALELENRALREFVATDDDLNEAYVQYALTGGEPSAGVDEAVAGKRSARQRLATEHGLPLPEVER